MIWPTFISAYNVKIELASAYTTAVKAFVYVSTWCEKLGQKKGLEGLQSHFD